MGKRYTERETKTETNTYRERKRERETQTEIGRDADVCTASQGITYSV